MPKPVKKTRRSPSDPNLAGADIVSRSLEAHDKPSPPRDFNAQLSAYMSKLGQKGGKVSGERRMENLTQEKRSEIALKAAQARWARRADKKK